MGKGRACDGAGVPRPGGSCPRGSFRAEPVLEPQPFPAQDTQHGSAPRGQQGGVGKGGSNGRFQETAASSYGNVRGARRTRPRSRHCVRPSSLDPALSLCPPPSRTHRLPCSGWAASLPVCPQPRDLPSRASPWPTPKSQSQHPSQHRAPPLGHGCGGHVLGFRCSRCVSTPVPPIWVGRGLPGCAVHPGGTPQTRVHETSGVCGMNLRNHSGGEGGLHPRLTADPTVGSRV